jgi:4-alpha-glucanotransferase
MRLYVIPHGSSARDGAYLRFPFTPLLSVIAEESRRGRCIVIGEDLGTVPEGFRDTLAAWGIWSYLVMMFERNADGSFRSPEQYPEKALATFNTHDLPTYAGWLSGHDLSMKRAIGLDPGESDEERERSRAALRAAIGPDGGDAVAFERAAEFLARAPSRLLAIAIEDVLGVKDQINVPGTMAEHPNWRQRLPVDLEDLGADQRLRRIAEALARAGRSSTTSG